MTGQDDSEPDDLIEGNAKKRQFAMKLADYFERLASKQEDEDAALRIATGKKPKRSREQLLLFARDEVRD